MDKATGEGTLTTRWGVADDGAMVHVSVPATAAGRLDERWPPMGLTRGEEAGPSPDLVVVLRPGVAGTLLVEVDGEPTFGGWDRVESELALFAAERLANLVAVHAAAVAIHDRVLLVRFEFSRGTVWALPGGGIEPGEEQLPKRVLWF